MYVGVNNIARKIKSCYVGIDGKARKVKAVYVGVNGVAKLVWQLKKVLIKVTSYKLATTLGSQNIGYLNAYQSASAGIKYSLIIASNIEPNSVYCFYSTSESSSSTTVDKYYILKTTYDESNQAYVDKNIQIDFNPIYMIELGEYLLLFGYSYGSGIVGLNLLNITTSKIVYHDQFNATESQEAAVFNDTTAVISYDYGNGKIALIKRNGDTLTKQIYQLSGETGYPITTSGSASEFKIIKLSERKGFVMYQGSSYNGSSYNIEGGLFICPFLLSEDFSSLTLGKPFLNKTFSAPLDNVYRINNNLATSSYFTNIDSYGAKNLNVFSITVDDNLNVSTKIAYTSTKKLYINGTLQKVGDSNTLITTYNNSTNGGYGIYLFDVVDESTITERGLLYPQTNNITASGYYGAFCCLQDGRIICPNVSVNKISTVQYVTHEVLFSSVIGVFE